MADQNLFDTHFEAYDAWFEANANVYQSELRAIESVLPPAGDWVEVGVGTGRFAAPLGIPVGVEPSENMAALARKRGIEVIEGRAEALPLDNTSVDAVFLITSLCFVRELDLALREVSRVLRPGGHAIVAFVPGDSAIGQIYAQAGPEDPFFHQAILRSSSEMIDAIQEAGFIIEEAVQTLFEPPDRANDRIEAPKSGHDRGSFVVLKARVRERGPGKPKRTSDHGTRRDRS